VFVKIFSSPRITSQFWVRIPTIGTSMLTFVVGSITTSSTLHMSPFCGMFSACCSSFCHF
jgi:hypothetical protein